MISFLNEISGKWFSYLADSTIQLTFFFVVVFFLSYLFRSRSAKFLYGLWSLLLLKAILPPTIPLPFQKQIDFIPHISIPMYPMFEETTATMIAAPKLELSGVLFLSWGFVVLLMVGFIFWRNTSFRLKLRGAVPFDLNLLPQTIQDQIGNGKSVSVFVLDNLCAPFTINILRPKIYLPADSLKWDDKKLEAILMHEIAHIQRKDLWVNLFQNIIQVFYFFHPFVWFANWQLNNYRERACDDYAILNLNGYSLEYSKFLLAHLDRSLRVRECPALVNYFFQNKKNVMNRFEYLVKKKEEIMLHFKTIEKVWLALLVFVAFGFTLANSGITKALPDNLQERQKKGYATITGKITDKISKEAIPGANVFIVGTKLGGASGFTGEYVIKNVPPGKYDISVQMIGYEEATADLTVKVVKNEITKYMIDFPLEGTTIRLKPFVTGKFVIKTSSEPDSGYGKIRGKVVSKDNGKALPGANILIIGTRLGSAADPMGNFIILNVPPGVYELNVDMLGFKSKRVKKLKVSADLTTTIDFQLEATRERRPSTKPVNGWDEFHKKIEHPGKRALVSADVLLDKKGKVNEIKLKQASGDVKLDDTVLKTIANTKWTPILKKGKVVKSWVTIPVRFKAKDEQQEVPYDTPPGPIGGFTAIQKKLVYPEIARKAGIEGTVILALLINKEGEILETKVKKSLGNNGCDEAAIDAVRSTRWNPAIRKNKPVQVWVNIPVIFKLNAQVGKSETSMFVPYDSAPEPIGGFAAIKRNLKYPEIAKRAGIEGTVIAQILIDVKGNVVDTRILKSLGNNGCDEAAIEAIKKTKWRPALQRDKPVQVLISIPIEFKLKESGTKNSQSGKPEFVRYDSAPEPIGGFAAIQKNLEYPELAKRAGIQGMVIAQVLIDSTGQILETKVVKSLGENNGCDEAAIAALTKTKWEPAKQKDNPVKVWVSIPVQFKLDEQLEGLGKIEGVVKDGEGNPIKRAMVFIQGTELKKYTNSDGAYVILNVPPGKYQLICGTPDLENRKKLMEEIKKLAEDFENPAKREAAKDKREKLAKKMKEIQFEQKEMKDIKVKVNQSLEINFVLK